MTGSQATDHGFKVTVRDPADESRGGVPDNRHIWPIIAPIGESQAEASVGLFCRSARNWPDAGNWWSTAGVASI